MQSIPVDRASLGANAARFPAPPVATWSTMSNAFDRPDAVPPWIDIEDRLSPREFERLADFIERYSGIKVPEGKTTMLEGRLRKRVRALGLDSLSDYCDYLFLHNGLVTEEVELIDAVTTNKTEFFREAAHFRVLAEVVVPQVVAERRNAGLRASLKVWSAAASTGAEPYSIAMVLAEQARTRFPDLASFVYATDICTGVLETARMGIYAAELLAPVPLDLRARYTMRAKDRGSDLMRIVPELRARVQFGRVNLIEPNYPVERELDVVFCRNVLIYFDKPTQLGVLRRLCEHLRPGGHLFLGHSETLSGAELPVQPIGASVFRRI
ncbi:Chemotaxis protein methyltransferase CheR [Rhodovulum sp. PH10]|uniref:CheR family methyltransferase n=1 Tax=Rhodovulum sp. PH10 TaxID=1187851 RepID=UPI00027C26C1|nr:protein-glutamate O-methyltransferase [Rhodovulum sp. PH10]EJW10743.1 Chemotaxis protein methyltransferase CheR [Rhodovulum sp. PH10]